MNLLVDRQILIQIQWLEILDKIKPIKNSLDVT